MINLLVRTKYYWSWDGRPVFIVRTVYNGISALGSDISFRWPFNLEGWYQTQWQMRDLLHVMIFLSYTWHKKTFPEIDELQCDTYYGKYIYHYPIQYIKNCWVILLSNYNIKYKCTIYTCLCTCLTSIPRFALRKVTLRLLKLLF